MLKFVFRAVRKDRPDVGTVSISISLPRRAEEHPHDFECRIRFSGVIAREMAAFGVFPLQAVDLAIQIAKTILKSYATEWDFYLDDSGPIPFDY